LTLFTATSGSVAKSYGIAKMLQEPVMRNDKLSDASTDGN
jgi:hypothetical protein